MTNSNNQINTNHPRIKNRPKYIQEYRDNLAKNLRKLRTGGERGKKEAEKELKRASGNYKYILGRYGTTKLAAIKLIDAGYGYVVADKGEIFEELDQEIVDKLFDEMLGYKVVSNLEKFKGIDHKKIVDQLLTTESILVGITISNAEDVAENLDKFKGVNHQEIAEKLTKAGYGWSVAENLEKFENLSQKILERLIKEGYKKEVEKYLLKNKK